MGEYLRNSNHQLLAIIPLTGFDQIKALNAKNLSKIETESFVFFKHFFLDFYQLYNTICIYNI
ncbi:MAG: hypothetical protein A3K16_05525 [Omnitrophica bacterium RIFCSPLOWO2_01_FULL_45_24]|nr:MAG: hypothetical protein A3K16_05525 [Omnitrophica bacterium RIFCSPLOWO2_01_FULL_45_24]